MRLARLLCFTLVLCLPATVALAQTGKIAGIVTDAATGDPLPGVNVSIEGTTQGSVTNVDGYYAILNVRPGTYDVRASFIGFTPQIREGVRVNIDLTSEVDFQLREETVGLEEVIVAAERPVVQRDVSASLANIGAEEIENLPVTSVAEVIGLQAGFEPGLTVRGSGGDQVAFVVDGMSYTDSRSNTPFTGISYTAIDEVQVQTGGFNAEYGNVRSGLINVVTKDGPRTHYMADVLVRYSPPSQPYFGGLPTDPNAYWMRPYFDTTPVDGCPQGVAICGTSHWPQELQNQYPTFSGWQAMAETYGRGVTPEQMMEAFRWFTRKDMEISDPDYELDGTIGGPVPGISRMLGDLRFLASYRQTQTAYAIPQERTAYNDRTFQGKLTSDVGTGMKLVLNGMYAKQEGINAFFPGSEQYGYPLMYTGENPKYPWDGRDEIMVIDVGRDQLFNDWWWNPMDVTRSSVGAAFTHTLNARTFYEVQLQRNSSDYSTVSSRPRTEGSDGKNLVIKCMGRNLQLTDAANGSCPDGSIPLTEAPFGYEFRGEDDGLGAGMRTGGHGAPARDSSEVTRWQGRFDLTSQVNRYMQVKTGIEYIVSDYNVNHGEYDYFFIHHANPKFRWERSPSQGALYGQTKLEFKGMVANLGLRADYFHAGGEWYQYDAFDRAFASTIGVGQIDEVLETESTERQFSLSPRLGVSFPITEYSKLYFNYGHFRQMLDPRRLYEVEGINTGAVNRIGDPNQPLPKTVMYELGYEHSLLEQYHVRVAGFYRDLSLQPREVQYISVDDEVNYRRVEPLNYGDVRGFEVTFSKNRGDWIRGWINYTYLSRKSGNFGFAQINQNRVEQRQYVSGTRDHYQSKPIPEPFARFNLEVVLPEDFGPDVAGVNLLGDWRINFLGEWRDGQALTWNGQTLDAGAGSDPRISFNTSWTDYYNLDLRFAKNFGTTIGRAQFFVDVTNVLNLRHMNRYGLFEGSQDDLRYYQSLHMPEETFEGLESPPYSLIPGKDQPGDYRKPGVAFDPIYPVGAVGDVESPVENALYYDLGTERYMTYRNGSWGAADQSRVDQVLDDKAYIDMPNESYFTFLNPRNVYFGLRLTF